MELWIRSQDKTRLLKIFEIYIAGTYENELRANYQSYYSGCSHIDIGKYKTKERALEVLDEIQEILVQVNDPNLTILPILVYEMPSE